MTIFSERLKSLRLSRDIKQKEISDAVGVTLRAYQYYETATKEPTMSKLTSIAEYLGVSLDYLVGRTDNPKINR